MIKDTRESEWNFLTADNADGTDKREEELARPHPRPAPPTETMQSGVMISTQRHNDTVTAKKILFCRIGSPNGERCFKRQFHFLPLRLRVFASLRLKWAESFRSEERGNFRQR